MQVFAKNYFNPQFGIVCGLKHYDLPTLILKVQPIRIEIVLVRFKNKRMNVSGYGKDWNSFMNSDIYILQYIFKAFVYFFAYAW